MGNALIDVAGFTLLGRMAPDAVLARVFGVLESLVAVSIGIGAVAASWAVAVWGLRPALVVIGLVCPSWPWRRGGGCGRSTAPWACTTQDVGLLQRVPMLRTLPLPSVEQLARGLEPVDVPAGSVVFRQGDVGDRYYVVESGEVEVIGDGRVVAVLGPGEGFGEIALLRRTPRTATVVARTDVGCARCSRSVSCPSCSATRRAPARLRRASRSGSTATTPGGRRTIPRSSTLEGGYGVCHGEP